MAEVNFPTAGGGSVTDHRYELLMSEITGSGFLGEPTASPPLYADSTGRQVKVQPNRAAIVRGYRWGVDATGLTAAVAANTSGQPRLDLAVIRLDRADWSTHLVIKQGVPGATPVAPALTQQTTSDGVYEIPVASVRVASTSSSQASAGLPSIAAADVTALHYHLGPPPVVCHSTRTPPAKLGLQVTEYDTGKILHGMGSSYHLLGENGPWTRLTPKAGWDQDNIFVQRRNGFVYFQALMYRNSTTTVAALTAVELADIPDQFLPANGASAYLSGSHGAYHARFHINGTSGILLFQGSTQQLLNNQFVWIHPTTWPAR